MGSEIWFGKLGTDDQKDKQAAGRQSYHPTRSPKFCFLIHSEFRRSYSILNLSLSLTRHRILCCLYRLGIAEIVAFYRPEIGVKLIYERNAGRNI